MRILILAGKEVESDRIERLFAGEKTEIRHYANVSRGLRRLESSREKLVVLVPDVNDCSWLRAVRRVRREYDRWPLLITPGSERAEVAEVQDDIFDVFEMDTVSPGKIQRSLKHFYRQQELERNVSSEAAMTDWVETTGRLGCWEMGLDRRTQWSPGMRKIFGDTTGRLTDDFATVRTFVHPDDLEIFDQANKATFVEGWPLDFEYRIVTEAGEVRYLHLHRRVDHAPDGTIVRCYGMALDVTAEREFEHFLFKRDAARQVVGSFAESFLQETDWQGGIDDALANLGRAFDATRIALYKGDGKDADVSISLMHEWVGEGIPSLLYNPTIANPPFSPLFDRWKASLFNNKTVAGNVSSFQTVERHFYEQTGAKAIMIAPIFEHNRWWGLLCISDHHKERDWMPVETESLAMVTNIFGSAILRTKMEKQLVRANKAAEQAKTEALEASRSKSLFLANMSHEIRTPISGILGIAEMIVTTGLNTEQREHMDMIRDAARSLLGIVNDILDISKIEAQKLELKPENFQIRALLDRNMRPFAAVAGERGVRMEWTVAEDVPPMVNADPDRLGQILRNLVGNALKFTEVGGVDVAVHMESRQDGEAVLGVKVTDTGEGIAADKLGSIFDSFTQADSSVRKKHQGTGLGLTISRELVRMFGGDIRVESTLGKGTTFHFTIRVGVPEQVRPAVGKGTAEAPQTMHLNLLLAEDNPLNQKFLTHFLTMFGHKVTLATNGIEALEILSRQGRSIDLVLMDVQMPEMGGIEATQAIRSSDGLRFDRDIPIIALTAYAMKGDKERMLNAGMNGYVSKPVDMKELSTVIANCMTERKQKAAKPSTAVGRSEPVVTPQFDMDSLVDRFEGNMELLKEILQLFLLEADNKLARLDAAVMSGRLEEMGRALHSITNIASHVLAMEIMNLCRQLEKYCMQGELDKARAGVRQLRPQFTGLVRSVKTYLRTL